MKLENQVCSLELAQKLKNLGVKQDSLFSWRCLWRTFKDGDRQIDWDVNFRNLKPTEPFYYDDEIISAFTVAELGEMLREYQEKLIDIFIEKGANLEHIRWAKWQNYLHSFLEWSNEINAWALPNEKKEHWQRQIQTPYSMLSESEKESDRKEVRQYIPLLNSVGLVFEKTTDTEADARAKTLIYLLENKLITV